VKLAGIGGRYREAAFSAISVIAGPPISKMFSFEVDLVQAPCTAPELIDPIFGVQIV
jgi:hypothetical protein